MAFLECSHLYDRKFKLSVVKAKIELGASQKIEFARDKSVKFKDEGNIPQLLSITINLQVKEE